LSTSAFSILLALPALQQFFPGIESFNAFYRSGALFTFATYLGAIVRRSPTGILAATPGLVGIFLAGMLILLGTLPFWDVLRQRPGAQAIMRGINAAVRGGAARCGTV
jgi:hypothetical protein